MTLFNYHSKNLQYTLNFSKLSGIKLEIDENGSYSLNNLKELVHVLREIQKKTIQNQSTEFIEQFPPFEIHPYIFENPLPTKEHKTIVLGTFPPPSYLHLKYPSYSHNNLLKGIDIDSPPLLNYFYGNRGSLWNILGLDLDIISIDRYVNKRNIFVSDIILCTQRISLTKNRAADNNYINIVPNIPIVKFLLESDNSIENIVFTSKGWKATDGKGRGRRAINYIAESIFISEDRSAISLFFRTLVALEIPFSFQKIGFEEVVDFTPKNYSKINNQFNDLSSFYLILNNRKYLLNIGDSPSGNAFTPFDSPGFRKWIKYHYGENGIKALSDNPRNSKKDNIKRERKEPIQQALGVPNGEDICVNFQREIYSMFLEKDFSLIDQIENQVL